MITIWATYFIVALAASGVFIIAGWRSRQAAKAGSGRTGVGFADDPLWNEPDLKLTDFQADAGAAVRVALKRLAPIISSQSIRAEVAAPLGLLVRMRGAPLADIIEEMLAAVVHSAPASHILLTVARQGDRVYIAITDDVPGANPDLRRVGVRDLMERVALRGGVLDVDVRPAEGTTITLRLAAVMLQDQVQTDPEIQLAPPLISSVNSGMSR